MSLILDGTSGLSDVDGTAGTPAIRGSDANTGVFFGTDIVGVSTGGSERVRVDASGNVGIGTSSPGSLLQVEGAISMRGVADVRLTLGSAGSVNANTSNYIRAATDLLVYNTAAGRHSWEIGGTERARIDSSGNLLVGTTSPSFNAGSRGNITIGGSGSAIFALQTGGTAKGYVFHDGTEMTIANEANGFLRFYTNATERARIDSSGSLLVGMTSAFGKISIGQNSQFSYAQGLSLYFSGSSYWNIVNGGSNRLYFGFNGADRGYIDSSSGNYVSVSDQRLKKNIADIGYGLSSVLSLRPVSYNMNSQEDTEEKTLGFIAQEVLEVVPESVSEMMNGMYGMDKTAIIPVLVKAIQEQQALIQTLTARVAALESN